MRTFIYTTLFQLCLLSAATAQEKLTLTSLTDTHLYRVSADKNTSIVKGKIINAAPEELANMNAGYSLVQLTGEFQVNLSAPVQPDGTFFFELPQTPVYQQLWFKLGNFAYTCLYVKDGLEITFDANKLREKSAYMLSEGLFFSGEDGEATTLINQHTLFWQKEIPQVKENISSLSRQDTTFSTKLDSLFLLVKASDKKFKNTYASRYAYLIDNERESDYLSQQLLYHLDKELPNEMLDKIKQHPIYAISNDSRSYLRALSWYFNNHLSSKKLHTDATLTSEELSKHFSPAYADLMMMQFEDKGLPEQLAIYQNYLPFYHYRWSKALVQQQITDLEKKAAKINKLATASAVTKNDRLGNLIMDTPFDGQLYVNTQTTAESIIQQIRAKFPNQLVVLDFWATWCAPCIAQMPYSKQMHHEAKEYGHPIAFVYLCTSSSSSEEKWKNKVLELEQPGTHVYIDEKLINELMTLFNKSGFPSYVVIKPNGEIDTGAVSWMSNTSIDELKKLL